MAHIQLNYISLSFGERSLLSEITMHLSGDTRAALAGSNGSGKSTLMQIIAGIIPPDEGTITAGRQTRVAYLPQQGQEYGGRSLRDESELAFSRFHQLHREKEELEARLHTHDEHTANTDELLHRQHDIEERLLEAGYYEREVEIDKILTGLGFRQEDFDKDCAAFSGGWQMRIALAKILLSHPDILLLDEPTNYLDLEARSWLFEFLNGYHGGFLIVTHDRYFLDTSVNEIYELFQSGIHRYTGNYSAYLNKRNQELEELKKRYRRQQEEIARLEAFINKFRYNANRASQVQSRIKKLEKMERIELPPEMKTIHFSFPPPPHSGKKVLSVENLKKTYGAGPVIEELSLELRRGEKLVVTGVNGAGKSTLLRILAGIDQDYEGTVTYGSGVTVGYFSQDRSELEGSQKSIYDTAAEKAPQELIPKLRNLLGAFLFSGDDIYKPVSVLSGGEKSRLALLTLLLTPVNLLVLDEPTNHLDLHSKDVLLDALNNYSGTLVFVSHDRYFIEQLGTRVLELLPRGHRDYPGDYAYYLWRKEREREAADDEDSAASHDTGGAGASQAAAAENGNKERYQTVKQQRNRLKRIEGEEAELMEQLEQLEEEHRGLSEEMSKPEVYSDGEKAREVQGAQRRNEQRQRELSEQWEALEEEKMRLQEELGEIFQT
jgi:ATP-binding cassette subfamily F protein 3